MRKSVRILLVGDAGVGKSSLITSLIKEQFVEQVPAVVAEVTIPPEVTPEKVTTQIADSPSNPAQIDVLRDEIRKANVICVVYDVNVPETFTRLTTYWLGFIQEIVGVDKIPIILVGNKIDLRRNVGGHTINSSDPHQNQNPLERGVAPIMRQYKEVETCVECSAKALQNIPEVFYYAQKSVLHPTAPLYDAKTSELKPDCVAALRRIFHLCDVGKDNALSDSELNAFQFKCFGAPLQQRELDGVKEVVRQHDANDVTAAGLTEAGFLFLHKLFIQRGRLETTWMVLRKFGYDDSLVLRDDFLHPPIEVDAESTTELTSNGYQFFISLFKSFDKDHDGALCPQELEQLFSTSPGNPFLSYNTNGAQTSTGASGSGLSTPAHTLGSPAEPFECTVTTKDGWITLQGFLALWSMSTLLDVQKTLAYLAYLGYPEDTKTAIKVTRSKRLDLKKRRTSRNVFLVYVFGATGSGKTSLLRSFSGKELRERHIPTTKINVAVNAVSVQGADKYLVLQEFPANGPDAETVQNRKRMEGCALAVFVYDSTDPNSFAYVERLKTRIEDPTIPCLVVATRSDLEAVPQSTSITPADFCTANNLPPPIAFSAVTGPREAFVTMASVAMSPHLATKAPPVQGVLSGFARLVGLSSGTAEEPVSLPSRLVRLSLFSGVLVGAGYGVYRLVQTQRLNALGFAAAAPPAVATTTAAAVAAKATPALPKRS
ncbi:rho 1 protein [Capsaspora owczarzaki ATCC 30864]|uniref:Mitochondrial Rho GTPase n=1 Tax=Capsaspora owczarzaki (strain ATCC 30864) TaxID=595528 RepID=A0A0D2WRN5_CAPO3|nr:rho 1 protein [Capsaspora owczarzaki ATCC 30864]KJE94590.1 rho 1 protein [Capsaspora owczarzaki ATCC 30864]|eukprot:XP_004346901.2 rho 1 protein [Capsaspora owczarzaki ATCC 30864]